MINKHKPTPIYYNLSERRKERETAPRNIQMRRDAVIKPSRGRASCHSTQSGMHSGGVPGRHASQGMGHASRGVYRLPRASWGRCPQWVLGGSNVHRLKTEPHCDSEYPVYLLALFPLLTSDKHANCVGFYFHIHFWWKSLRWYLQLKTSWLSYSCAIASKQAVA